ncbi:MAG: hypothetical protein AAFN81_08455 [Bacteroidota bacterium]
MFTRKLPALLFFFCTLVFGPNLVAQTPPTGIAIVVTTNNSDSAVTLSFPAETQVTIDGLDGQYATVIDRTSGPDEYRGTFLVTLRPPNVSEAVELPILNGKALFFDSVTDAQAYQQAQDSGQ